MNKNYKCQQFNNADKLACLFPPMDIVKIRCSPMKKRNKMTDRFGNQVIVEKLREQELGILYRIFNIDFADSFQPNQMAIFDNNFFCICNQEIEEGAFDPELHLQNGLSGKCEYCGQTWNISYKVRPTKSGQKIEMKTIIDLWELGADIFPALEKELYFD